MIIREPWVAYLPLTPPPPRPLRGLGFSGFRVQGLGFRVQGLGFRV